MFRMWYRYSKFKTSERLGQPVPRFKSQLPFWNSWLMRYQAKKRRSLNADVMGPISHKLRLLRRWQLFTAYEIDKRRKNALAAEWATETLLLKYFKRWTDTARGRGGRYRKMGAIMLRWHAWAAHQAWQKRNIAQVQSKLNMKLLRLVFASLREAVSASQRVTTHGIFAMLDPNNAQLAMRCVRAWRGQRTRFLFLRIWKCWRG